MELLKNYTAELERRNFSKNTIKTYAGCFLKFTSFFAGCDIRYVSDIKIKEWLKHLVDTEHISPAYQNQLINAVKFYYEQVLNLPRKTYYINRPRPDHHLPNILSQPEMAALMGVILNTKHRAIVALLYSTGMRVSEIINLKVCDIDSKRMVINLRQVKGNKDRQVQLSNNVLEMLRLYTIEYRQLQNLKFMPDDYLFSGQTEPVYTESSIRQFLKKYAGLAGIKKNVYPHLLRHSCFTHLRDNGTDMSIIQQFAGHKNQKTTLIYAQLSTSLMKKVTNPFDQILQLNP